MNATDTGEDKTPRTQQAHYCPDWDFLLIRPGDAEMEVCTCPVLDEPSEIALAVVPGDRCQCLPVALAALAAFGFAVLASLR
jgi:hypothetical protein